MTASAKSLIDRWRERLARAGLRFGRRSREARYAFGVIANGLRAG